MLNNTHNNQAPLAESQRVEFKRQLSGGLEKEVVAFLNVHDGGLSQGFSQDEFFMGYSVPQNKELMRVFRDVDLVEQLGSGIPRILQSYTTEAFCFTDNFTRLVLPFSQVLEPTGQATGQVTGQAEKLLCGAENNKRNNGFFRSESQGAL